MDDKERRRHRRHHVNIPAELFVHGILYPCRIRNISEEGFFVKTDVFLSVEEKVLLTTKDIPIIEKTGITLRIDPSGIGGMFEEKGTFNLDALSKSKNKHTKRKAPA